MARERNCLAAGAFITLLKMVPNSPQQKYFIPHVHEKNTKIALVLFSTTRRAYSVALPRITLFVSAKGHVERLIL